MGPLEAITMIAVTLVVLTYLLYSLLRPERF
jgi:K+-transporting ATPase KdpF subunit